MIDVGLGASLSSAALRSVPPQRWAHAAVAAGFTSVWSLENPLTDQAEPLVFLTAVACAVPSLNIGTAALIAPIREPVLLARQCATLDHIAPGRLSVGVTIGRRSVDYELTGADYHRRGRVLDDVLSVLRQCWDGKPLHVIGTGREWVSTEPVGLPPATPGGPVLLVGGLAPAARARAVTKADGYLASATGGPRKALEMHGLVCADLDAHGRSRSGFRMVANVFVHVGDDDRQARDEAVAMFMHRHRNAPPSDPEEILVAGSSSSVTSVLVEFAHAGWDGVNLVPLEATLEQVERLAPVAAGLRGRA